MSSPQSLQELAAYRGKELLSSEGMKVGEVQEVIYDYLTTEPVWLGVGVFFRTLMVPVSDIATEGRALRSSYSKAMIDEQPVTDFGAGFGNSSDEHRICEYFGMPRLEGRELRVLGRHDNLPGSETAAG